MKDYKRYSGDRRLHSDTFKYGLLVFAIAAAIAAAVKYAPGVIEFIKSLL